MSNSDQSAYPLPLTTTHDGETFDTGDYCNANLGLTKREAFAMAAMKGLLSNSMIVDSVSLSELEMISEKASLMADLQLKAL